MFFSGIFNRFLHSSHWIFYFVIAGGILALVLAPPRKSNIIFSDDHSYWPTVEKQAADLLKPVEAHRGSHAENKSFRLAVPLIAKILHLDRKGIFMLQGSTLFVMISICLALAYRITSDRLFSVFFMGSMIPLYVIQCSYQETTGHLDAFAYTFLFCSLYFRHPAWIFIYCTFASWCDERAFIATALIFAWWYFQHPPDTTFRKGALLNLPNRQALAVLLSMLAYVIFRTILVLLTPLSIGIHKEDLSIILQYLHHIPLLTYLTFGGLWAVLLLTIGLLVKIRAYSTALAVLLPLLLLGAAASLVWDFTRSLSFAFPALFISLLVLQRYVSADKMRPAAFCLLLLAMVTPLIHFDSQLNYVPSLFFLGFEAIVRSRL